MHRADADAPKTRILVINHFFDGEIEALTRCLRTREDIEMLSITPEPFFSRALVWFPEAVHNAQIEYDAPELKYVRQRYRRYCEVLFQEISTRFPFDCILTPSDSFYWLREFIEVCRRNGVPTIVADKEGTISPRSFDVEPLRIKKMFPPLSDYFFVWSERQRAFWLKSGVSADRIHVIGSMRTDLFVASRGTESKTILCFDFDADAYINNMDWQRLRSTEERTWDYLRDAIHRVLLKIAQDEPEVSIVIKCHPQQAITNFHVTELLEQPNVKIIKGSPRGLPPMVADAIAVVGFQTTALLEAALAEKPVFYVAWGDLYELVKPFVLPWSEPGYGMDWITSEQALEASLRRVLRGEASSSVVDRSRLPEYFHQADGHVTERLIETLVDVLEKH